MTTTIDSSKQQMTPAPVVGGTPSTLSDYDVLRAHGHSPMKAAEIALDAKRGVSHAVGWVAAVRSLRQ